MTESLAPEPLRILVFGAHPDDAEYHMGGLLALYRGKGHAVKVIAVTNGDAGHHEMSGPPLAQRRKAEAEAAMKVIGAACDVWDNRDGRLQPTLDLRWQIIAEIRRFRPDLVVTHRPNDYHPDHRALGQAVQDASYLVTVPPLVTDVPALRVDPVVAYMTDRFTKPTPLQGDVVLDVSDKMDIILEMTHCHTSQSYEWLPFNRRVDDVPSGEEERKKWLLPFLHDRWGWTAERYRSELVAVYGREHGEKIRFAEAYEISEYAAAMDDADKNRLFPFLP